MRQLDKRLAIAATATALAGAIGASVAQGTEPEETDRTVQKVEVNGSGQQIYFFRDQGNSPESDPAAHLMLIKHEPEAVPVAQTTTSTTVAQATTSSNEAATSSNEAVTSSMPAASDTSNTETRSDTSTAAAPADNAPPLAPKADRN